MNELIKQIKQIIPPRSSESKTREPFRSQVIDGAQEGEGSAQSSHWVRDTCDKNAHSIVRIFFDRPWQSFDQQSHSRVSVPVTGLT